MLISWFTVVAQIVNFLILVWLLKRFLYQRVIDAMDERQAKIAATLEQAEAKRAEATRAEEEFRTRNEDLEKHRKDLQAKAAADVGEARKSQMQELTRELDVLRGTWRDTVDRERETFVEDLERRVRTEVLDLARKALADLANAELETAMAEAFVKRLQALDKKSKAALADALETPAEPVLVKTVFELPDAARQAVEQAIRKELGTTADVRFEMDGAEIGGIELSGGGQKLAWTVDDYLDDLGKRFEQDLVPPGGASAETTDAPASETSAAQAK